MGSGLTLESSRRRRDATTVSIRKKKKNEKLRKKRLAGLAGEEAAVAEEAGFTTEASGEQKIEKLPLMIQQITSDDPKQRLESCMLFRKLLSIEMHPPIDLVIEAGVVPLFVEFLSADDDPQLQFEAAWALTNIASGQSYQTREVITNQAVPQLVKLLATGNAEVREQVVWCLGNIAGDSTQCRDYVLHCKIMEPLLYNLTTSTSKVSMLRNATWTLSNLCRGKPQPDWSFVSPSLPTLARLIYSNDEEVLTDALWALSYLSDGSDARIQQVIDAGVCRRVVELLTHHAASVQVPALRTVGNIVTGNDVQTQCVLNCAVLPCLLYLLGSPKENIKKEACWTISNITDGTKHQIKAVIDANLIAPLIEILNTSTYYKTRKEAAWAISNLTSGGSPEHIRYIVSRGAIKPLCDLLFINDPRIVLVALEGLENILKIVELDAKTMGFNHYAALVDEADGLEKLDAMQSHQNHDVYQKASSILTRFFAGDSDDEGDFVAPDADGGFAQNVPDLPTGGFNI